MKHLIITILFIGCYCIIADAQWMNSNISRFDNFKGSTVSVLSTGNEEVDNAIFTLLSEHWTHTELRRIDAEELPEKAKENTYFIGLFELEVSYSSTTSTSRILSNQLVLLKDAKFKKGELDWDRKLVWTEIPEDEDSEGVLSYEYLQYAVQSLENQTEFILQKNSRKDLDLKDYLKLKSKENKALIKSSTLYVDQAKLKEKVNSAEELANYYTYDFEIVDADQIKGLIANRTKDVVYPLIIHEGKLGFVLFISAYDSEILFGAVMKGFDHHHIGPRFFKEIN